jgi:hypothetical protein
MHARGGGATAVSFVALAMRVMSERVEGRPRELGRWPSTNPGDPSIVRGTASTAAAPAPNDAQLGLLYPCRCLLDGSMCEAGEHNL